MAFRNLQTVYLMIEVTMLKKANCWEVMACGREPGGKHASAQGVCPAALDTSANGLNGGKNAGRICWAVGGTFCGEARRSAHAEGQLTCLLCRFFKQVQQEEGEQFHFFPPE